MPTATAAPPDWLGALFRGERAAIARAITAVENETAEAAAVLAAVQPRIGRARLVGFTGAPGAGKSTLVGAYVGELRRRGQTVGVVAVDPSSPLSGGAILGDRVRMTRHAADPGVFVRSLASRGHLGGLSRTAPRVVDVLDAAGMDVVVIETVGAGQSEIELAEIADVRVVVCAPGLGDDIQALKAGILEIADILVVNKADQPLAERTARQLAGIGREGQAIPVLKTSATAGTGVAELAQRIESQPRAARAAPHARVRRLLVGLASERLERRLRGAGELDRLSGEVLAGRLDFHAAAGQLLTLAARDPP